MRVLHVLKTSDGAVWAMRQITELTRLGVDVHVALPAGGRLVGEYRKRGITVHEVNLALVPANPVETLRRVKAARRLVEMVQPSIIHSHFVATTMTLRLALGRSSGVPRVFQVPGPLHLENPLTARAEIRSSGAVDYWIGSCEYTVSLYRKLGVPNHRLGMSYYGTDLSLFDGIRPGKLRAELGLPNETRVVGMVAYVYPPRWCLGHKRGIKGHEDLIDAMELLLPRLPFPVVAVFVGGAWIGADGYEKRVRRYAKSRLGDRAIFLGTRDDVQDLYADFDVAVHPSHSENLGGAAESLLSAVPTVATDVGGFPDIVRPGVTGWLVPPRSPRLLSEAILAALTDAWTAKAMANRGRELVRSLLDVRRTAREVAEAYSRILSTGRLDGGPRASAIPSGSLGRS